MGRRVTLNELAASLDRLAAMTARGFEDVRRDLTYLRVIVDGHTATLAGHAATLTDHTHRLDRIERKLDNTVVRLDDHDVRLQALEKDRGSTS